METGQNKNKIMIVLQAFFISFALTVQFHTPIQAWHYGEWVNYILAEAAELLGEYHFTAVLIFVLALLALHYVEEKKLCQSVKVSYGLPLFFSFCLCIGKSYAETGNWSYCFGSLVNFAKTVMALVGWTLLLHRALLLLLTGYEKVNGSKWQCKVSRFLFEKSCFVKIFLLLLILWAPVILLSYPGNVCYDVIGQIEQVVGNADYSAHHPLLHTLLVGGMVELGGSLLGSYDIGLFCYIWVQAVALASALAGTIWWLSKQKFLKGSVSHSMLLIVLGIYICSPMYSNMVSTAIKDIPFVAAFIWYLIVLAEVCFHRERLKQPGFVAVFVLVQVMMSLLRNNGFYVMVLTGLVLCACWWKESEKSMRIKLVLYVVLLPLLLSKLGSNALLLGLDAEKGSSAEIFSLPFQQTARYMQLYRQELTAEEKTAIEQVLGDVNVIAERYDPDIADPVKALFYEQEEVTAAELVQYFAVWFKDFFKHPTVYLEAFFAHVYGWFDPQVSSALRYEADYDLLSRKGLFTDADKVLVFIYRLADRMTPFGLLQNVGAYTWMLLLLTGYLRRTNGKVLPLLVPLLISLLICMAAPCFYLHPRYAYPYMFTLPFLYGMAERSRE